MSYLDQLPDPGGPQDRSVINVCLYLQTVIVVLWMVGVIPDSPIARLSMFTPTAIALGYSYARGKL